MKKIAFLTLLVGLMMSTITPSAQTNIDTKKTVSAANNKIEVYYFHSTRRCPTCNAVEDVTKKALEELYPKQLKQGKIVFTSVNMDKAGSKKIAQKCKADGKALIIISKDKREDLTQTGFLNALRKPEVLKADIKKAIDSLL